MQQRFLLQFLLRAQHVSGTTMPIIRSSRVLCSGCCLWYFVLWFSSCWSGVELRVMCPVCRMLQNPANRTHNPQLHTRPATWKLEAKIFILSRNRRWEILLHDWAMYVKAGVGNPYLNLCNNNLFNQRCNISLVICTPYRILCGW